MTMLSWPSGLPLPFEGAYAPFVRSLSGGQSLSGFEQVQPQMHDRWQASFALHLNSDARILALRALLTGMRGRANSLLLPAYDRGRGPYSSPGAASPIGNTVVNPAWTRAAPVLGPGTVLGTVVALLTFAAREFASVPGAPQTLAAAQFAQRVFAVVPAAPVSNPPVWRRWAGLAGTTYEFSPLTLPGSATVLADDLVRFVPTGAAPEAGQWITLAGVRHEILRADADGGARLLQVRPPIAGVSAPTFQFEALSAYHGSATVLADDLVRYVPDVGTVTPPVGVWVTITGVRHEILGLQSDGGAVLWRVAPPIAGVAVPTEQFTALPAYGGIATILADDRVGFVPIVGSVAPPVGVWVAIAGEWREILRSDPDGGGVIWRIAPPIDIAVSTPVHSAVGVTGTATITAADTFSFAPTAGAPAVGDRVTLFSAPREIVQVVGAVSRFAPPLVLTPGSGSITAVTSADAALNATVVRVTFSAGGPPLPGHLFSLSTRMHSIDAVAVISPNVYDLTIWPWLRAAVSSGTTANFATPACAMRFATDQEGVDALRALRLGKFGDVTLSFDEVP